MTRPALSDERIQLNASVQVERKLRTPWRDGTTHLDGCRSSRALRRGACNGSLKQLVLTVDGAFAAAM